MTFLLEELADLSLSLGTYQNQGRDHAQQCSPGPLRR